MKPEECFPWKEGDWEQRLRDLAAEGLRPRQIAMRLAFESKRLVTRDMVARKTKRLQISVTHDERRTVEVDPNDPNARIAELWNAGLSAGAIAKQLGTTRNSIVGKVHRMGLPGQAPKPRPDRRQQGTSAAMAKTKAQKPGRIASQASIVPAQINNVSAPPLDPWKWDARPLPESKPAFLIDLEANQCRWPLEEKDGVRGRHLMCGAKTFSGCYCHEHWERSLTPEARARMAAKMKQAA